MYLYMENRDGKVPQSFLTRKTNITSWTMFRIFTYMYDGKEKTNRFIGKMVLQDIDIVEILFSVI